MEKRENVIQDVREESLLDFCNNAQVVELPYPENEQYVFGDLMVPVYLHVNH